MLRLRLSIVSLAMFTGACAESVFGLGEGAACERSVQCGPGLACVEGVCDPDATGLGGEVPDNGEGGDAAVPMDGGNVPPEPDAGDPPDPPPVDAG